MMVILYAAMIALFIVTGQALWKSTVNDVTEKGINLLSSQGISYMILSPKMIIGTLVYAIATLSYIYLLSKFNYFQIQSIVVGGSLVMTLIAASFLFGERPSLINIIGIFLILCGSIFVISR